MDNQPDANEMLEALKETRKAIANILDNCPYFFPDHGDASKLTTEQRAWRDNVQASITNARAAIAKAEGRTQ